MTSLLRHTVTLSVGCGAGDLGGGVSGTHPYVCSAPSTHLLRDLLALLLGGGWGALLLTIPCIMAHWGAIGHLTYELLLTMI